MRVKLERLSGNKMSRNVQMRGYNKQIFQMNDKSPFISIEEARSAFEICHYIKSYQQQAEGYVIFNMDGDMVEEYLLVIENLEKCYKKSSVVESWLQKIFHNNILE